MKTLAKVVIVITLVMLLLFYEGLNIVYENNQAYVNSAVDASKFEMNFAVDDNGYISTYGYYDLSVLDINMTIEGVNDLILFLVPISYVKYVGTGDYFFDKGCVYLQGYEDYQLNVDNIYISVWEGEDGVLAADAVNYSVPFAFPQLLSTLALIGEFSFDSRYTIDWDDNEDILDYVSDIGMCFMYPFAFIYHVFGIIGFVQEMFGVVIS